MVPNHLASGEQVQGAGADGGRTRRRWARRAEVVGHRQRVHMKHTQRHFTEIFSSAFESRVSLVSQLSVFHYSS